MNKIIFMLALLGGCYGAYRRDYTAACADECFREWALTPGEQVIARSECYGKSCTCHCVVPKSHPWRDGMPVRPVR